MSLLFLASITFSGSALAAAKPVPKSPVVKKPGVAAPLKKKKVKMRKQSGPGVPRGAVAECEDGVISYTRAGACGAHGGVMMWFR